MMFALLFAVAALAQDPAPVAPPKPPSSAVKPFVPDEQGLAMRVRPIADGLARDGSFTALRITLLNIGPSTTASLSYSEPSSDGTEPLSYTRTVELPRGGKKEVVLPVKPSTSTFGTRSIVLSTDDGRGLAEPYKLDVVAEGDVTVGVIGDDALGINALGTTWGGPVPGRTVRAANSNRNVRVGLIDKVAVPDRTISYGALDWVVWNQPDPSELGPEQVETLKAWVADGGHLFLCVTTTAASVKGSALDEALPVELGAVEDRTLGNLGAAIGFDYPLLPAPSVTATTRTVPGRDVWTMATFEDQHPAWVIGTYGLGTVSVLLADPTVAPLKDAAYPRDQLWRRLLWLPPVGQTLTWYRGPNAYDTYGADAPYSVTDWASSGFSLSPLDTWTVGADTPISPVAARALHLGTSQAMAVYAPAPVDTGYGTIYDWEQDVRDRLNDIPGVAPLPMSWLLLFSVIYLLFIGPIDYGLLRALGRQPATWITFPIYIALFSALALVGTSLKKGNQAAVVRVELVDGLPGTDRWRGESWIGVFATRKTELSLKAGFEDATVTPLARETGAMWEPHVVADEGPGSLSWRAETWTLGYARTAWSGHALGAITVTGTPDRQGVIVKNDGPVDLIDSRLFVGNDMFQLGPIKRGETQTFATLVGRGSTPYFETSGTASIDLREATEGELMDWAAARQALRPVYDRGLYEPQFAVPTVLAVARQPVEPLVLSGLEPETRQITVLRVPVPNEVVADLASSSTTSYLPTGGVPNEPRYPMGTVIKVREVHRDDSYNYQRTKLVGGYCTATAELYPTDMRYFGGSVTCQDGQPYYFWKWSFDVVSQPPPIPTTPIYAIGSVVKIKALDPGDNNKWNELALLGLTCTVSSELHPSTPSLYYSGSVICGDPLYGQTYWFDKVQFDVVSEPKSWPDQSRVVIKDISGSDGYAYDKPRLVGQICTTQGASYPSTDVRFQTVTLNCADGGTYYFYQVEIADLPVSTPPVELGDTDAIPEIP